MGAAPPVIGRAGELTVVQAVVDAAAHGAASALLISGEAGVGKTSLVRTVTASTIWASCLPLTSLAVPLLPLRSALRPFPDAPDLGTTDAVLAFDTWLDRMADDHPTVLIVDDVQWADQSSLDVLMYVLAGRADRRLGVLLTMRSGEEESGGHGLRRWLADVRRLPRVTELRLDRLDRVCTRDQLTALLGRAPFESLVDDVYARSRGNPYLTRLLAHNVSPDAVALPDHLPTELRDALSRTWHGLSAPARRLTAIVAVGGRPDRAERITEVASAVGFPDPVLPLLSEAVEAGVLRADPAGRYWFAHPLLAEALVGNLLPDEQRALHAAFTEAVGQNPDGMNVDDVVTLADHFWHAGNLAAAYRWALRAASMAEVSGGAAEALRLLRRALDIWPRLREPEVTRISLLHRVRQSAHSAGRQTEELAAVDELLALIDRERDPLAVVPLLLSRTGLRRSTGVDAAGTLDGYRDAERLSARFPDSVEHALATAHLARSMIMNADDPAGIPMARTALRLARHVGSELALGHALTAAALADAARGKLDAALRTVAEAREIGMRLREFGLVTMTAYVAAAALEDVHDGIEMYHEAHEQLTAIGAPHPYVAEMCAWEAECLLSTGDWRRCEATLRVALGGRPSVTGDVRGRLTAATLACRQGRQVEADAHLARANEIFADHDSFRNMDFDVVRVEVAVTAGDPDRAVALALAGLAEDPQPLHVEMLLPLAARALADRAAAYRDRGADAGDATARLTDLRSAYPDVVADVGADATSPVYQRFLAAMQAVTEAETVRGFDGPDQAAPWHRAAEACHTVEEIWTEAYCRWREAEAALRVRGTRSEGTVALRAAHRLATVLQAAPILTRIEGLARGARIPLTAPAEAASGQESTIPGLTGREREILAHLVAGRTYSEIAKALVLSEKTVSVHVSNMLRKTGTTNRVELAQLAHRRNEATAG